MHVCRIERDGETHFDDVRLLQWRGAAAEHGGAAARQRQEGRHEAGAPVQDVGERAAVHHERAPAAARHHAALQIPFDRRLRVLLIHNTINHIF